MVKLRTSPDTFYIWVGGSCDYSNVQRAGGAAYIIEKEDEKVSDYVISDVYTTEFRMILSVMIHAMSTLPALSNICFLSNVAYLQNFDKNPTENAANSDLINECIHLKKRHKSCYIKIVPYHKFRQLAQTHDMAHQAMLYVRHNK